MSEQIPTKPIKSDNLWYRCIDGKIAGVDPLCYHESGHVRKHLERIEEEDEQPVPPGMMSVWRNYLDDNQKFGHSPIPVQITSDILSIVNEFCVSRCKLSRGHLALPKTKKKKARLKKKLHDFDVDFVEKNLRLSLLVRLMDAAFQLEIPSLLHITSEAIVHMLKSEQKLLKKKKFLNIFNLPDFTHDVWKDPSIGAQDTMGKKKEIITVGNIMEITTPVAIKAIHMYRSEHVIEPRRDKKQKIRDREWSSLLSKTEYMLLGELDEDEVDVIFPYFGKRVFMISDSDEEDGPMKPMVVEMEKEESKNLCIKGFYECPSFLQRLRDLSLQPSSYEGYPFVDKWKGKKGVEKWVGFDHDDNVKNFKQFAYWGPKVEVIRNYLEQFAFGVGKTKSKTL